MLGLQLYTLKDLFRADPVATLRAVRSVGYRAVECPWSPELPPGTLKRVLEDLGLTHLAMVGEWSQLSAEDGPARLAESLHSQGTDTALFPWIPGAERRDADAWRRAADKLAGWGDRLRSEGVRLMYHFHGYEFSPIGPDRTGESLLRAIPARSLCFQVDTYWAVHGGRDPAGLIRDLGSRVVSLHCKDMADRESMRDVEAATGCLPWEAILDAARFAGVADYVVEQEAFDRPPLEAAALGRRALAVRLGLEV